MTVRTRAPDTQAHTREMLESILRPHSLEELYALVGSFPFKAVKVCNAPGPGELTWSVGRVLQATGRLRSTGDFVVDEPPPPGYPAVVVDAHIKQWRLAE